MSFLDLGKEGRSVITETQLGYKDVTDNLFLVESEYDTISTSDLQKDVMEDSYAGITIEDDSPIPEVRAAVPSTDDPTIPQSTLRLWVIGLLMTTIGSGLNVLFSLHAPVFTISLFVTAVLAWPMGVLWEKCIPNKKIFGLELNPGKFNIKEHTVIIIMSNAAFGNGAAYASNILLSMKKFYHRDFGWGFNLLAIITTQCIGLSLAGVLRKVLINPSSMVWPENLVTCTFLTNIHMNVNHSANGWTVSRLKFFIVVFICGFVWYWFPGFLFQALSYFAWVTWIKPKDVYVNQIFGITTGLGLMPMTFDWNQVVGYMGSPLIPPADVLVTVLLSIVIIFWILVPILHYTNVWYGKFLPISDSLTYDRFQHVYDTSRILNKDLSFNLEAYKSYSSLYLSTTFAVSYGLQFAACTSVIVYTLLFHGKMIYKQLTKPNDESDFDVHARLMKLYKTCPDWWYLALFVSMFALSIVTIEVWPTELPVYGIVVALLMAIFFIIPVGVLLAMTNMSLGLNVISEFIASYLVPGQPIAMMLFKTYTYISNAQAIVFTQDLKLGHYMKIAPRLIFASQLVSTLWGAVVQLAVVKWAEGSIEGVCELDQKANFNCPNARVFFNASVIWGVIGAQRQYSPGNLYSGILLFFVLGGILPIISWLILRKWPNSHIKHLNWAAFFTSTSNIPPATPFNYTLYSMVGLLFGFFVKRKWFHWWSKYNYTLSALLDSGLAYSSLIIFLTLTLTSVKVPNWWGNNVIQTIDYNDEAIQVKLKDGETFGLSSW